MARKNDKNVDIRFNRLYFDTILRSAKIVKLEESIAEGAASIARTTAPVRTGAYKASIRVEHHKADYRDSVRVVADDPKALLVESKTGNLARALKRAKRG